MASKNLIVDDDYCKAMGAYFEKQGEELDELVVEYISILQELKSKAIVKGDVSKALSTYISYVKKMKDKIGNISDSAKTQIDSFLERIDAEDKYLF